MKRALVTAWVGMMALATVPNAVAGAGTGGLTSPVCINLGMLLALTITPVETLVDAFRGVIPGTKTGESS